MRALGLKSGDTLALMIDNSLAYFDLFWAAQRSGLFLVPVPTRLTAGEVKYILDNSEAQVFVCSAAYSDVARQILADRPDVPGVAEFFAVNGALPGYRDWYGEIAGLPETPIAGEEAGSHMAYSSGTTGRPKGLRNPLRGGPADGPNQLAAQWAEGYGISESSVYLTPAPMYHSAPLVCSTSAQRCGATVILMPRFDPEDFLAAIERYRVTATQVVPTMFVRLLRLPEETRRRYDLSSLRTVIHAAAPCPVPIKHQMIAWLGPIIAEHYSASEANGSTQISSAEWLAKPGSVGRASWGTLHICDEEGNEVPAGTDGIIYFEGALHFEYHGDAEKTAGTRNPLHPTWTTVGDIGHVDADGYLFLTDRKDFMIISGGANIYPQEIENVLVSHPQVADVAVFGVPHPDMGEQVKALVQPVRWEEAGPELAQALEAWCREHLSPIKMPRSIEFEAVLPRAENGKLYKKDLRARYWPQ
ncbi:MAG: acyl-CoA synthetase [Alphaproteobacteria bacterium]|nr:acyl-CoA synthetase [Alphaproteobacteria bacterium]